MSENEKKFDLQERLIDYAVIFWLPSPCLVTNTNGTSPAANYVEVQSAEYKANFIYPVR